MFGQNDYEVYWSESGFLPVDAVLNYWCNGGHTCIEAKKHALIAAMERGQVAYKRNDCKTFQDPINELYANQNLLVEMSSFRSWVNELEIDQHQENLERNLPIQKTTEATYLKVIGALVDVILKDSPAGNPHSVFKSQSSLIETVLAYHGEIHGFGKRSLEEKFSKAHKALKDASYSTVKF